MPRKHLILKVCGIQMESFADIDDVDLEWSTPGIDLANKIELPNLKVKGT